MKHTLPVTILLLGVFLVVQFFGLFVIAQEVQPQIIFNETTQTSTTQVTFNETAVGPRPAVHNATTLLYIAVGVGIGTLLILFLARQRKGTLFWKVWYGLAVCIAMTITLGVFMQAQLAFLLAVLLTFVKLFYRNFFTHTITEILVYTGIALLLVPLLDLWWVVLLLILIALYDMYAVWKSKHMITLANFTSQSKLFPGLAFEYSTTKNSTKLHFQEPSQKKSALETPPRTKKSSLHQAVLGGGDIIFPLLFSGVLLTHLLQLGLGLWSSFWLASIVSITSLLALGFLFFQAKKRSFYPAMPFIAIGCFLGLGLVQLILLLL